MRNLRPADGMASNTVTLAPPCASTSAAISPAGPAPMTAVSFLLADMCNVRPQRKVVMAGLDPAIHEDHSKKDVDARVKPGHNDGECSQRLVYSTASRPHARRPG